MEAWSIIEDAYVDAQFGGHQWEDELSNALVATYSAENGEGAYKQISAMLAKLGDPFTRIVPASCVPAHHKNWVSRRRVVYTSTKRRNLLGGHCSKAHVAGIGSHLLQMFPSLSSRLIVYVLSSCVGSMPTSE